QALRPWSAGRPHGFEDASFGLDAESQIAAESGWTDWIGQCRVGYDEGIDRPLASGRRSRAAPPCHRGHAPAQRRKLSLLYRPSPARGALGPHGPEHRQRADQAHVAADSAVGNLWVIG